MLNGCTGWSTIFESRENLESWILGGIYRRPDGFWFSVFVLLNIVGLSAWYKFELVALIFWFYVVNLVICGATLIKLLFYGMLLLFANLTIEF